MAPVSKVIPLRPEMGDEPKPVALEERTDDALMLLARGGVRAAFDTLVRRHQSFALSVAYKYLGSWAAARDAAQNAFLDIYRSLPRYRAEGRFRGLLHRAVVNHCRMAHRAASSERRALEARARMALVESEAGDDNAILARERSRELARGLARLSQRVRMVVVLRFAGGLSYREIADALKIPLGTVKSRLFLGLEQLRDVLTEDTP